MSYDIVISRLNDGGYVMRHTLARDMGDPVIALSDPEAAFTTLSEALAFIRSRMEPEGEGEKERNKAAYKALFEGSAQQQKSAQERLDKPWQLKTSLEVAAALDKLQAEGQKFDATPTDPPWKRAKQGDWVRVDTYQHPVRILGKWDRNSIVPDFSVTRDGMSGWTVTGASITEILPTPPRHGDFGSRPEEGQT